MEEPKVTPPQTTAQPSAPEVAAAGATPAPAGLVPAGMMRLDLHCHSEASSDCRTPIKDMTARCLQRGISVQAITDHNQVWGAQMLRDLQGEGSELLVIVGEEVSTLEGEIIGLFLQEKIPAGLSPEATIERIKAQGGLVLLPHGFDPLKRNRLTPRARARVAEHIDIVETFNAQISRPRWNRAALDWAEERQLPKSAGSDAHTLHRMGNAWVQCPKRIIAGPQDLLLALREGNVMGEWTHPLWALAQKAWDFARRGFKPRSKPVSLP